MFAGVGRTRSQDVERRQGFAGPDHRSRRFSAPEGEEGLQEEEATAKGEKVSSCPAASFLFPSCSEPAGQKTMGAWSEGWLDEWMIRGLLLSASFHPRTRNHKGKDARKQRRGRSISFLPAVPLSFCFIARVPSVLREFFCT